MVYALGIDLYIWAYQNLGITMEDGPPKSLYFFLNFIEVLEPKRSST